MRYLFDFRRRILFFIRMRNIKEVFLVYLINFENAVTHLFLLLFGISDFHGLI